MTAGSTLPVGTETGAAVLEVERFEWATPERIEIVGVWTGLRARRFIRPTLVLQGAEGGPRRLLALLEHKPWTGDDGEEWIAAFAWRGDVVKFESADLNVGSGIDVKLPPPRMRPGKPRRFKHRAVSRDAARDPEPVTAAVGSGVVTDEPKPKPKPKAAKAADKAEETVALDAATADAPATPDPAEALRVALDEARRHRDHFHAERDEALEKVKAVRAELEAERQSREKAVASARAEERESASTMLAQGGELRAAVERQREMAYHVRDEAEQARDAAVEARDRAVAEKDDAVRLRKQADQERDKALAERDRANKERDRALDAREAALRERDQAFEERAAATEERDTIVSVHERGLPVLEPKSRFMPEERREPQSDLELWMPRVVAVALLFLFLLVVVHLFGG
jgi:hypothetical protein